jgi:8-oxo-dGTP diphosphatase
VLLAKRTKPPFKWSFPGGSLEPGETAAQAAIREAREEISVEIEVVGKTGDNEVALGDNLYVISVFAARLIAGEPKAGPEASEIGWFDVSEIVALDATDELAAYAAAAKHLFLASKA